MKRLNLILAALLIAFINTKALELDFNLQLNHKKIQSTNDDRFVSMKNEINNLIQNNVWLKFAVQDYEMVNVNFLVEITDQLANNKYKATFEISSTRPVYNSTYSTNLLSIKDENIEFTYIQGENFDYNENSFVTNMSSVCAYYVYLILGLDADSFKLDSGTEYFKKAENVASHAQSKGGIGWNPSDNSNFNRYKIILDLLNSKNKIYRETIYQYHRKGLDFMHKNSKLGRKNILESLKSLQKISNDQTALLQIFYDTKIDEIVEIFSEADQKEKKELKKIIKKSSPSRLGKLDDIMKK
jgi:hypothetical protein